MGYWIYIQLKDKTVQEFQHIFQQMNQAHEESLSKPLGNVLTEISCEVIDQVFSVIRSQNFKGLGETEHTLEQITENLKKYMPWSISLFSNERLLPMVGYIHEQIEEQNGQWFLKYPLDELLAVEALNCVEQLDLGQHAFIHPTFEVFLRIIDQGVNCLIREPKKMLKFNIVVDKTLNGVIHVTTQLGYKRIEKIASHLDIDASRAYFHYFMGFLKNQPNNISV